LEFSGYKHVHIMTIASISLLIHSKVTMVEQAMDVPVFYRFALTACLRLNKKLDCNDVMTPVCIVFVKNRTLK
jgi:hypothetical protein